MRAARCLRLSTAEQNNGLALERQLFAVNEACRSIGARLDPDLLFQDVVSGRKHSREGLDRIIELTESRLVDVVVFYRVDRLSRDVGVLNTLAELFERTGVKVYEVMKGGFVDFTNSNDWEYWMRSAVAAEGESRKLQARVKSSRSFARHKEQASMSVPWGYRRVNRQYALDDREWISTSEGIKTVAAAARRSIEIFLEEGKTASAAKRIALEVGKTWTRSGFSKWIRNEVLRGHTPYGRDASGMANKASDIRWNTHAEIRLLSEFEYQQVQQIFEEGKLRRGKNAGQTIYPLTGLVTCLDCGHRCYVRKSSWKGKDYFYVDCRTRRENISGYGCAGKAAKKLKAEAVEAAVIDVLVAKAATLIDSLAASGEETPVDPAVLKLRHQIESIQALRVTIDDEDGLLLRKIGNLEQQIDKLQGRPPDTAERERIREHLKELGTRETWEAMSREALRSLFFYFVEGVDLQDNRVVGVRLSRLLR